MNVLSHALSNALQILVCTWGVRRRPLQAREIILNVIFPVEAATRSAAARLLSKRIRAMGCSPRFLSMESQVKVGQAGLEPATNGL